MVAVAVDRAPGSRGVVGTDVGEEEDVGVEASLMTSIFVSACRKSSKACWFGRDAAMKEVRGHAVKRVGHRPRTIELGL